MGFNKRILTKESIMSVKQEDLARYFNVDSLIMDAWSSKFVEKFRMGYDKETIIKMLDDGTTTTGQ
jgi:hypothetical protein